MRITRWLCYSLCEIVTTEESREMDQYLTAALLSYPDAPLRQQVLRVLVQEGLVRRITSEIYASIIRQHV
jgi:hypothetical protein